MISLLVAFPAAAGDNKTHEIQLSNVAHYFDYIRCGRDKDPYAVKLKAMTVTMLQAHYKAEGKPEKGEAAAIESFDANLNVRREISGRTPPKGDYCDTVLNSAFINKDHIDQTTARARYLLKYAKSLQRKKQRTEKVGGEPYGGCLMSAQHYQDAYMRESRVSDLVCMNKALKREMK